MQVTEILNHELGQLLDFNLNPGKDRQDVYVLVQGKNNRCKWKVARTCRCQSCWIGFSVTDICLVHVTCLTATVLIWKISLSFHLGTLFWKSRLVWGHLGSFLIIVFLNFWLVTQCHGYVWWRISFMSDLQIMFWNLRCASRYVCHRCAFPASLLPRWVHF